MDFEMLTLQNIANISKGYIVKIKYPKFVELIESKIINPMFNLELEQYCLFSPKNIILGKKAITVFYSKQEQMLYHLKTTLNEKSFEQESGVYVNLSYSIKSRSYLIKTKYLINRAEILFWSLYISFFFYGDQQQGNSWFRLNSITVETLAWNSKNANTYLENYQCCYSVHNFSLLFKFILLKITQSQSIVPSHAYLKKKDTLTKYIYLSFLLWECTY